MSLTALIFVVCFAGGLVAALLRHPLYGLYVYIATFYLHPVDRWWGAALPDLRWSLLAAAVTVLATFTLPARPDRPSWLTGAGPKLLLVFTVWLWIQNAWAVLPEEHLEASILFTKYLVLVYLMYRLIDTPEAVSRFLLVNVLGCLYLSLLVLAAPADGRLEGVGGPGIDEANALGMHLATGLVFAGALVVRGRGLPVRAIALASVPLIVNAIIQTESRGTFLGVLAGGAVMLWLSPVRYRKYWYLLGVLGVVILVRVSPENYWERMATISAPIETPEEVDNSAESRLALLSAQWQMFLDYPVGVGHRGTAYLSPRYLDVSYLTSTGDEATVARSSHNTFMSALVEQGLPGALLFVWLALWIVSTCRRVALAERTLPEADQQLYPAAVAGALAVVLVAGLFTDYLKAEVFIWCLSLLLVLTEMVRQRKTAGVAEPDAALSGGDIELVESGLRRQESRS